VIHKYWPQYHLMILIFKMDESAREALNVTKAFDDCEDRVCSYGLIMSQQMMEVDYSSQFHKIEVL